MSVDCEVEAEADAEADADADAKAEAEAESRSDAENEVKSTGRFLFMGTFEKLETSYSLKGQVRVPDFSLIAPAIQMLLMHKLEIQKCRCLRVILKNKMHVSLQPPR